MATQAGLVSAPWADPTSALALMWPQISPIQKFGGELLYSSLSAIVRHSRPCQPSTATSTACTLWHSLLWHQHSSHGHGDKEIFFSPPWPSLLHWARGSTWPCLGWQPGCQRQVLCSSWMVTQPGNQHRRMAGGKPSWPSWLKAEMSFSQSGCCWISRAQPAQVCLLVAPVFDPSQADGWSCHIMSQGRTGCPSARPPGRPPHSHVGVGTCWDTKPLAL